MCKIKKPGFLLESINTVKLVPKFKWMPLDTFAVFLT